MKRILLLTAIVCLIGLNVSAQYNRVMGNRPFSTLKTNPGFVTINELGGGYGLAGTTTDYSKFFFGFTSINGYQINKNFIIAGGVGINVYESGIMVPLFIDYRFAFNIGKLTPYVLADGGLMIKVSEINYSEIFVNPGAGLRYSLSRSMAVDLSAGLHIQSDGNSRSSFINVKSGIIYLF